MNWENYTKEIWDREMQHHNEYATCQKCQVINYVFAETTQWNGIRLPLLGLCRPCPNQKCSAVGFYAARHEPNTDRKYRMCKFCGLTQNVDEDMRWANRFRHNNCPKLRDAPTQIKWLFEEDYNNGEARAHFCGFTMTQKVQWPTGFTSHPLNNIRNEIEKRLSDL